jgi:hypothetical protein
MNMNAFVTALYRDVTCGAAAALITLVLGMSFVQSTQAAPGMLSPTAHTAALHSDYSWFGQPEPAVLVD